MVQHTHTHTHECLTTCKRAPRKRYLYTLFVRLRVLVTMPYRATDTDHLRTPVAANSGHATSRAELGVHLHLALLVLLARLPGVPAIYQYTTVCVQ